MYEVAKTRPVGPHQPNNFGDKPDKGRKGRSGDRGLKDGKMEKGRRLVSLCRIRNQEWSRNRQLAREIIAHLSSMLPF